MARSAKSRKATHRCVKKANLLNKEILNELIEWVFPKGELFRKDGFHGNVKWEPEQLVAQALIWAWHETKHVTDAYVQSREVCAKLKLTQIAQSYTSLMNALNSYREVFQRRLGQRLQQLAEEVGGRFWRHDGWLLVGFDGSRATTPRSLSNEKAFCAPNYGNSGKAKTRRKKAQQDPLARARRRSKQCQPQVPQAWITMMWHMGLKLPWTWRLGPSHSCEKTHVKELLQQSKFPENTLFCGDAGFVGYPLWKSILDAGGDLLVRVGGNVHLLSETADVKRCGGGQVLCWPKNKRKSGDAPLRLRLVQVKIGKKTKAWILTSVLDRRKLPHKKLIKYYKMRWGIEVAFRGLKQTLDKRNLRCRNSNRVLVELDWSILAMAIAELLALRHQIPRKTATSNAQQLTYDPKHRSLARTMRSIRKCMRNLDQRSDPSTTLNHELSNALVQQYRNTTDKKARYRPENKDHKPLADPQIRKMNKEEREKLRKLNEALAA